MKSWMAIAAALTVAGCTDEVAKPVDVGNHNVEATIVGEVDGCTLYSVVYGYRYMFMRCPASTTSASSCHGEMIGKVSHTVCSQSATVSP